MPAIQDVWSEFQDLSRTEELRGLSHRRTATGVLLQLDRFTLLDVSDMPGGGFMIRSATEYFNQETRLLGIYDDLSLLGEALLMHIEQVLDDQDTPEDDEDDVEVD